MTDICLPKPDQEYILDVIENTLTETPRKLRGVAADDRNLAARPFPASAPRVPEARPPFDDALREEELQHIAVLGYN
ncbi:hypothetical protein CKO44_05905 [Rubrivivax gelatinosus]|uniref:Uncharacterized protein n=1 Tax=Rubrivivax gelatinosus TaxID=28068 RepID=A0ABS1DS64_RUBGE|nr:hypothetical protein [Rubrivivax gelatinosus]MBK1613006.1 hypothetical protein [Rubrivivax gelatinosus]MBK1712852.1 hypothetical protein [Rubrivivax gelatinosus]